MGNYRSPLLLKGNLPLSEGTIVIFLLGSLDSQPLSHSDGGYEEFEWTTPKRKCRGINKVDVRTTPRVGKPPTRNLHHKEIEKDIAQGK